jgi:hypothetical protein
MDRTLEFTWNLAAPAEALRISVPDVELHFRDGCRISFILERHYRSAARPSRPGSRSAPDDIAEQHIPPVKVTLENMRTADMTTRLICF